MVGSIHLVVGLVWGLAFSPADYQQGNGFRIIYVSMAVAGLIGLVWQIKQAHLSILALAPIGAKLTFLSLVTGAI